MLAWPAMAADRRDSLTLGNSEALPKAGLRLHPFRDFKQTPIASLSFQTRTDSVTGAKYDTFVPYELWRHDQTEAIFQGRSGRITVAVARLSPGVFSQLQAKPRVSRTDMEKTAAEAGQAQWTPEDLDRWVTLFAQNAIETKTSELKDFAAPFPCTRYLFKDSTSQGFLFTIPRDGGSQWVYLHFQFFGAVDERTFGRDCQSCAKTLAIIKPSDAPAKTVSKDTGKGPATESGDSPERLAARDRVQQEIRNLKGWWLTETPHYIIATDLPQNSSRQLIEAVQTQLEALRGSLEKIMPPLKPITDIGVVRIFADRQAFHAQLPDGYGPRATGAWLASKAQLLLLASDTRQGGDALRLQILRTLSHEAYRQYAWYALNRLSLPAWFNEGHAAFAGTAEVDTRRKTVNYGESEWLARQLTDLLKKEKNVKLSALMTMTGQQFSADAREEKYAVVWGLVYFFRKAAFLYPGKDYDTFCAKILRDQIAAASGDAAKAMKAADAPLDMNKLQRDFYDFWGSSGKRKRAERYDPLKGIAAAEE